MPIATGHEREELEAELEVIFLFLIFAYFTVFFFGSLLSAILICSVDEK